MKKEILLKNTAPCLCRRHLWENPSVKEITGDRIVEKVKVEGIKTGNTNIIKTDAFCDNRLRTE